jgi:hypothetical protein
MSSHDNDQERFMMLASSGPFFNNTEILSTPSTGTAIEHLCEGGGKGNKKPCLSVETCIVGTTAAIMNQAMELIEYFVAQAPSNGCAEESAVIKTFLEKRPKFAYGYMLAFVSPWKYALGYCFPPAAKVFINNNDKEKEMKDKTAMIQSKAEDVLMTMMF